jgi:hypothetical protein
VPDYPSGKRALPGYSSQTVFLPPTNPVRPSSGRLWVVFATGRGDIRQNGFQFGR